MAFDTQELTALPLLTFDIPRRLKGWSQRLVLRTAGADAFMKSHELEAVCYKGCCSAVTQKEYGVQNLGTLNPFGHYKAEQREKPFEKRCTVLRSVLSCACSA